MLRFNASLASCVSIENMHAPLLVLKFESGIHDTTSNGARIVSILTQDASEALNLIRSNEAWSTSLQTHMQNLKPLPPIVPSN